MTDRRPPYLFIEQPDTEAQVDFPGRHAFTVKIKTSPPKRRGGLPEVSVVVIACDDRNTILSDIVVEIPRADDRR